MVNEAQVSVAGYIATAPTLGMTRSGLPTLQMRLAWTPRRIDRVTGDWVDDASSFATVKAYRRVAENGASCLRKGEPVIVTGTLHVREYEGKEGGRRTSVEIMANSIGYDLARGMARFIKLHPQTEMTAAERQAAEQALAQQGDTHEAAEGWPAGQAGPADRAEESLDEVEEIDEVDVFGAVEDDPAAGQVLDPAGNPADAPL